MIEKLSLQNFRSYEERSFVLGRGVNVIVGPNGAGKTNILEAIYVLLKGSSFRVSLKDTIRYDKEWSRIDAMIQQKHVSFRHYLHEKPYKRLYEDDVLLSRSKVALPSLVLFEPEFLHILSGSPARRRAYLDYLSSEWFPEAKTVLRRYDRVLLQRNNLLKSSEGMLQKNQRDQLFVWNIMLAELAAKIEGWRHDIVELCNASLSAVYNDIAASKNQLEVTYSLKHPSSEQDILHQLTSHEAVDVRRGFTSVGPHRHDFSVLLNDNRIDTSASRGEMRTISIALKKIEILQHEASGHDTIILFDDVFSELDEKRQAALMKDHERYQMILITPHIESFLQKQPAHFLQLT